MLYCVLFPWQLHPWGVCVQRVQAHEEESALLKAYIGEWSKYFTQCDYLPKPFQAMEMEGTNNKPKKKNQEGNNRVKQVRGLHGEDGCVHGAGGPYSGRHIRKSCISLLLLGSSLTSPSGSVVGTEQI